MWGWKAVFTRLRLTPPWVNLSQPQSLLPVVLYPVSTPSSTIRQIGFRQLSFLLLLLRFLLSLQKHTLFQSFAPFSWPLVLAISTSALYHSPPSSCANASSPSNTYFTPSAFTQTIYICFSNSSCPFRFCLFYCCLFFFLCFHPHSQRLGVHYKRKSLWP